MREILKLYLNKQSGMARGDEESEMYLNVIRDVNQR